MVAGACSHFSDCGRGIGHVIHCASGGLEARRRGIQFAWVQRSSDSEEAAPRVLPMYYRIIPHLLALFGC